MTSLTMTTKTTLAIASSIRHRISRRAHHSQPRSVDAIDHNAPVPVARWDARVRLVLRARDVLGRVTAPPANAVWVMPANLRRRAAVGGSRPRVRVQRDRAAASSRGVPNEARAMCDRRHRAGVMYRRWAIASAMGPILDQEMAQEMPLARRSARAVCAVCALRAVGRRVSVRVHGAIGVAASVVKVKQINPQSQGRLREQKVPTGMFSRAGQTERRTCLDRVATARRAVVVAVHASGHGVQLMQAVMPSVTRSRLCLETMPAAVQACAEATVTAVVVVLLRVAIAAGDKVRGGPWKSRAARRVDASASRVIGPTICPSNRASDWTRCPHRCAHLPGKGVRRVVIRCVGWLRRVQRRKSLSASVGDGYSRSSATMRRRARSNASVQGLRVRGRARYSSAGTRNSA